jgi:osmotically inducible protein OsmC
MPVRTASAKWEGDLREGAGRMSLGSGAFDGQYSFGSRFEEGTGTNPEELIGAAQAGCFSMFLANLLAQAGHAPRSIETTARIHLDPVVGGFAIKRIELASEGDVENIDEDELRRHAEAAKEGCPVSKALTGVEISLDVQLVGASTPAASKG